MRDDRERLLDISEAIARIEMYSAQGKSRFESDELLQVWVVHHIELIGEASAGLSADLRERHPEVPWSDIIGMRNALVHHYFGVDLGVVWSVVERDIPVLKAHVERIIGEFGTSH